MMDVQDMFKSVMVKKVTERGMSGYDHSIAPMTRPDDMRADKMKDKDRMVDRNGLLGGSEV